MKPYIQLKRIWDDDDLVELGVTVCDGKSLFSNTVYASRYDIKETVKNMETFKNHIHGGIYDLKFGAFGHEYAGGGFQARLHFYEQGKGILYISTYQQSDSQDFKGNQVASEAYMYLKTEPALFDRFIADFEALSADNSKEANMECLQ